MFDVRMQWKMHARNTTNKNSYLIIFGFRKSCKIVLTLHYARARMQMRVHLHEHLAKFMKSVQEQTIHLNRNVYDADGELKNNQQPKKKRTQQAYVDDGE